MADEIKRPQSVVMVVPFDRTGAMIIQHRSDKVRSAPNCWSFPSGLQEYGETIVEAASRELREELGLEALRLRVVGHYDNLPGDGYHWAITIVTALVEDVRMASNLEPDKHDRLRCAQAMEMLDLKFWMVHTFSPAFADWARNNCVRLALEIQETMR